jgi:hypothetical protein
MWGNTVADAASARTRDRAERAADLPALAPLLDQALLADLAELVAAIVARLEEQAALAGDVLHLLRALPPLIRVLRYGNVRRTDADVVGRVVASMVTRAAIGLPGAALGLDADAAAGLDRLILDVDAALGALDDGDLLDTWRGALRELCDGAAGLLAGRACRLLLDAGAQGRAEAGRRAGLALSPAEPPERAGAWAEGFLGGSAALLLFDDTLWRVVDDWLGGLDEDAFKLLLPLLRRTFARYSAAERRSLGERAGRAGEPPVAARPGFDPERARAVLPTIALLLGEDLD